MSAEEITQRGGRGGATASSTASPLGTRDVPHPRREAHTSRVHSGASHPRTQPQPQPQQQQQQQQQQVQRNPSSRRTGGTDASGAPATKSSSIAASRRRRVNGGTDTTGSTTRTTSSSSNNNNNKRSSTDSATTTTTTTTTTNTATGTALAHHHPQQQQQQLWQRRRHSNGVHLSSNSNSDGAQTGGSSSGGGGGAHNVPFVRDLDHTQVSALSPPLTIATATPSPSMEAYARNSLTYPSGPLSTSSATTTSGGSASQPGRTSRCHSALQAGVVGASVQTAPVHASSGVLHPPRRQPMARRNGSTSSRSNSRLLNGAGTPDNVARENFPPVTSRPLLDPIAQSMSESSLQTPRTPLRPGSGSRRPSSTSEGAAPPTPSSSSCAGGASRRSRLVSSASLPSTPHGQAIAQLYSSVMRAQPQAPLPFIIEHLREQQQQQQQQQQLLLQDGVGPQSAPPQPPTPPHAGATKGTVAASVIARTQPPRPAPAKKAVTPAPTRNPLSAPRSSDGSASGSGSGRPPPPAMSLLSPRPFHPMSGGGGASTRSSVDERSGSNFNVDSSNTRISSSASPLSPPGESRTLRGGGGAGGSSSSFDREARTPTTTASTTTATATTTATTPTTTRAPIVAGAANDAEEEGGGAGAGAGGVPSGGRVGLPRNRSSSSTLHSTAHSPGVMSIYASGNGASTGAIGLSLPNPTMLLPRSGRPSPQTTPYTRGHLSPGFTTVNTTTNNTGVTPMGSCQTLPLGDCSRSDVSSMFSTNSVDMQEFMYEFRIAKEEVVSRRQPTRNNNKDGAEDEGNNNNDDDDDDDGAAAAAAVSAVSAGDGSGVPPSAVAATVAPVRGPDDITIEELAIILDRVAFPVLDMALLSDLFDELSGAPPSVSYRQIHRSSGAERHSSGGGADTATNSILSSATGTQNMTGGSAFFSPGVRSSVIAAAISRSASRVASPGNRSLSPNPALRQASLPTFPSPLQSRKWGTAAAAPPATTTTTSVHGSPTAVVASSRCSSGGGSSAAGDRATTTAKATTAARSPRGGGGGHESDQSVGYSAENNGSPSEAAVGSAGGFGDRERGPSTSLSAHKRRAGRPDGAAAAAVVLTAAEAVGVREEGAEPTVDFEAFLARMAFKIQGRYPSDTIRRAFFCALSRTRISGGGGGDDDAATAAATPQGPSGSTAQPSAESLTLDVSSLSFRSSSPTSTGPRRAKSGPDDAAIDDDDGGGGVPAAATDGAGAAAPAVNALLETVPLRDCLTIGIQHSLGFRDFDGSDALQALRRAGLPDGDLNFPLHLNDFFRLVHALTAVVYGTTTATANTNNNNSSSAALSATHNTCNSTTTHNHTIFSSNNSAACTPAGALGIIAPPAGGASSVTPVASPLLSPPPAMSAPPLSFGVAAAPRGSSGVVGGGSRRTDE